MCAVLVYTRKTTERLNWKTHFAVTPDAPSHSLSQPLWYSIYIQIDKKDLYFIRISGKKDKSKKSFLIQPIQLKTSISEEKNIT